MNITVSGYGPTEGFGDDGDTLSNSKTRNFFFS
jgi:hypothetical protein